jgi:hypothetical protein
MSSYEQRQSVYLCGSSEKNILTVWVAKEGNYGWVRVQKRSIQVKWVSEGVWKECTPGHVHAYNTQFVR